MRSELAINVAFPPKRCDPLAYYLGILEEMQRQGIRVFRLWLSDFSFNYYAR